MERNFKLAVVHGMKSTFHWILDSEWSRRLGRAAVQLHDVEECDEECMLLDSREALISCFALTVKFAK